MRKELVVRKVKGPRTRAAWTAGILSGLFLAILAALPACRRRGAEKVSYSSDGKAVEVSTPEGTARVAAGDTASVPADFPKDIPIYPGGRVTASFSGSGAGGAGQMVTFETDDAPEKVVAYYKGQLSGRFSNTADMGSAGAHTLVFSDGGGKRSISVVVSGGSSGPTTVQLTAAHN
jgi:hypothetical protein